MYLYRGKDRRMMIKVHQVLTAILKRDQLALLQNKKTTQLSTRNLILDNLGTNPGLKWCANQILTQMNALLSGHD